MASFKNAVRSILPVVILQYYHWCLAVLATWWYGYPSEKMIVVGVTGTKGKSTTANIIAQLLEAQGEKVGLTSTATMKVAEREWLSARKMTMPGRFELQKLLRQMVDAGCTYAVVETSSEGLAQFRSVGINYDVVVLTNFTPEHIEAHGGYENYRAAKAMLFTQLKTGAIKKINGRRIEKKVVINPEIEEYLFFSKVLAGEEWHFRYGSGSEDDDMQELTVQVKNIMIDKTQLQIAGRELEVNLAFGFNALNIVAAVSTLLALGFVLDDILVKVPALKAVPGRQEMIDAGQRFSVMIDYTHEPTSMSLLYQNLKPLWSGKIIQVFGGTGGGRDRWRLPVMGELAAREADAVIVTMDDPYDDDPDKIAEEILVGVRRAIAESGRSVVFEYVADRRQAMARAFSLAMPSDLVLITGKGAEQKMALANGQYVSWDDRTVAREELVKLLKN